MRRWILATLMVVSLTFSVGCFLPAFSAERSERARQLIFVSEDFRALTKTWERFWFLDQPDHMSPELVHGGVL